MPIGNAEDISLRALRILRSAATILAETPAVSRRLLLEWDINARLLRYGGREAGQRATELIATLNAGRNVALICDAGTPGIADACLPLVRAVLACGLQVTSLPGPAAVLVALTASGLPTDRFVFDGFPPRHAAQRTHFFRHLAQEERTMVLYESPAGLRSTLLALEQALGSQRAIALAYNLTKPSEAWLRGTIESALVDIHANTFSNSSRGEYTLVIAGCRS